MDHVTTPRGRVPHRSSLVVAGSSILAGNAAIVAAGPLHPSREDPNNHPAVFAEYAVSTTWIGVHYAQFAAAIVMLAGFVVLYRALTLAQRTSVWAILAVGAAIVAAAAVAILQAIDGVALKHAVDAWASAPETEKAARFADAEAIRWLEWGANSFFYTMVGITLGLFGVAILHTALVARWLGGAALLGGVAFVANAVPVGFRGFQATAAGMVGVLLLVVTAIGLVVAGLRAQDDGSSGRGPQATQRVLQRGA